MNHSPKSLREIVGQPPVRHLIEYADYVNSGVIAPRCFLLCGEPGTGKSASAHALAAALGCHDEFSGRWQVGCTELTVDACRELFGRTLRLRFGSKSGMNVLILEELEWISPQCQRFLKMALDPLGNMPGNLCVVATSNATQGLDKALLDRFKKMPYSNGQAFMVACQARLKHLWAMANPGEGMPMGWQGWGRSFETEGFSMRSALASLDDAMAERCLCAA